MSYSLFDKDEHWHKPEQAFLTDDHRTILRFAVEALMSGKGAVLVTLVEIRGGAARPLGAQMVVREDGRYCGFVSGGCVEAAAAFEALEVMGSAAAIAKFAMAKVRRGLTSFCPAAVGSR